MSDLEGLEAYVSEPTEITTRKQAAARRNLAKAAKTAGMFGAASSLLGGLGKGGSSGGGFGTPLLING